MVDFSLMGAPGWISIVRRLQAALPANTRIVLAKEKMGHLRVQLEPYGDKEVRAILREAEEEAARTCQACSEGAGIRCRDGVWATLRDVHGAGWDVFDIEWMKENL